MRKARAGARDTWQIEAKNDAGETTFWDLETQVQIDRRFPGLPSKRVDFLLTPGQSSGSPPIVVELDGWEHHAGDIAKDLQDRLRMVRSGRVRVWTLTWDDLKPKPEPRHALAPISSSAEAVHDIASKIAATSGTSARALRKMLGWLTSAENAPPTLDALLAIMREPGLDLAGAAGVVGAALYRSGDPRLRPGALSAAAESFLSGKAPTTGFRSGDLVLLLNPSAAAATGSFEPEAFRAVLSADLEDAEDATAASGLRKQTRFRHTSRPRSPSATVLKLAGGAPGNCSTGPHPANCARSGSSRMPSGPVVGPPI
ncbi:hypothetical protein SAMN05444336_1192 [Albimonas donghaensis]|uniref:Uncharacterized protein n=1 Tax=Albimonas donghaensis TaxID=356660 RepID=A0A1H3G6D3_9RHOB|nr:hypothetical protein [Albimonas donghaensis]SDX98821.1 hypothetical protein SAMN05444336_1192 [Albimonas donghaensis]